MELNFSDRIKNLSPKQKELLKFKLIKLGRGQSDEQAGKKIMAYVIGDKDLDTADLKCFLKDSMPDYMVPALIFKLEEFPRLPNGKIDLSGFPDKPESKQQGAPSEEIKNPVEEKLVSIFEEVLNFNPVNIEDNFFEIGGDSILSIQVVAKARKVGLEMEADELFEHQTIKDLAAILSTKLSAESDGQITDLSIDISDYHKWQIQETEKLGYDVRWTVCELDDDFDTSLIDQTLKHLSNRHDALRLKLVPSDDKITATISGTANPVSYRTHNLGSFKEPEQKERIPVNITEALKEAGFSETPFQVLYFKCRPAKENKIVFIANRFIVDDSSWQILVNDFTQIYNTLRLGGEIASTQSSKFIDFLNESMNLASDSPVTANRQKAESEIEKLEIEFGDIDLDKPQLHTSYNTQGRDLVIAALSLSLNDNSEGGDFQLVVNLDGRQHPDLKENFTRTIGCFDIPVLVMSGYQDSLKDLLPNVKEQLRFKSMNSDLKPLKKNIPLRVEYIKELEDDKLKEPISQIQTLNFSKVSGGPNSSAGYCSLTILHKNDRLILKSCGDKSFLSQVNSILSSFEINLNKIINFCNSSKVQTYTPSDFPDVELSQNDLDSLLKKME